MKKIVLILFLLAGWYGNYLYKGHTPSIATILSADDNNNEKDYVCDGRKYCSQMTSCNEAIFFIQNCPDTKMDGDGDGVPCERQWCGRN